jgi:hypothetical protein
MLFNDHQSPKKVDKSRDYEVQKNNQKLLNTLHIIF